VLEKLYERNMLVPVQGSTPKEKILFSSWEVFKYIGCLYLPSFYLWIQDRTPDAWEDFKDKPQLPTMVLGFLLSQWPDSLYY
jgi:hypothetical protein